MQVIGILVLPFFGQRFQALAEILGFELDGTDNMGMADFVDFFFETSEFLELVLVVL